MARVQISRAWLALVAGGTWAASTCAQFPFQVLVRPGQSAPGSPGATFTQVFSSAPALNDSGQIIFQGSSTDSIGIWRATGGIIEPVVMRGAPAPGTSNTFDSFANPGEWIALNNQGNLLFRATLAGPGIGQYNYAGLWTGGPGTLSMLARQPDQAAGAAPGLGYYWTDYRPVLSDSGVCAFRADLTSGRSQWGIFAGTPGAVTGVAVSGNQVPGMPAGTVFWQQDVPVIDAQGNVAFFGQVVEPGAGSSLCLWRGPASGPSLMARTGTQAPGLAPGTLLSEFSTPSLSSNGTMLVKAVAGAQQQRALYRALPGQGLELVTARGLTLPGLSVGQSVNIISNARVSNSGAVCFEATTSGAGPVHGVWYGQPGALNPIILGNPHAPGEAPGVFLGGTALALNNIGSAVILAGLFGSGVTSANDQGLYAWDAAGGLAKLVRKGDMFEVQPGLLKQIQFIQFAFDVGTANPYSPGDGDGTGGSRRGLNDQNQLAFGLTFTDSTSIIVTTTIPGPSGTAFGLLICGTAMLRRVRRTR